ncbi:MAG: HEPN domain-containing protein [Campylobacterota bacterium]|nr:HEPN domain-containing protein [Campylobacterota bacterium]
MQKSEIKNSSDLFLYKAIIDLNSAKYLLDGFNHENIEIDIDKIYFELQQSAEKALKSLLSKHTIKFPKSHDIEHLINICIEEAIPLIQDVERLIELSDFAVEGRYSIISDDLNDSELFIHLIEKLIRNIAS